MLFCPAMKRLLLSLALLGTMVPASAQHRYVNPVLHMGLQFFGMIVDLEQLLGRSVDLVVDGNLLPFARESAEKDKVLVYERAS